jgi:hypothetical protein
MLPEFQVPPSAIELCVVLSLFNQLIVVPTEMVSGLVPNAVVVNVDAPLGIVTVVLPSGAGWGVGDGDVADPPHPVMQMTAKRIIARQRKIMTLSLLMKNKGFPTRYVGKAHAGRTRQEMPIFLGTFRSQGGADLRAM